MVRVIHLALSSAVAASMLGVAGAPCCRAQRIDRIARTHWAIPVTVAESSVTDVHVVADEADAVLAILAARRARQPIPESDWSRLFGSEGYRRLAERERSFNRPFSDSAFRTFVLSDTLLARQPALAATAARWSALDITAAARRALAYLPAGTPL